MKAYLSSKNGYTIFQYGNRIIHFKAPYSLEKYISVKEWNRGYLVVDAKYKHNKEGEEEYIDVSSILKDLYMDSEKELKEIDSVEVKYA